MVLLGVDYWNPLMCEGDNQVPLAPDDLASIALRLESFTPELCAARC